MGGHVNMMDDVLISNLPVALLRSSLRTLVSQGSITQQPFVQHVRQCLKEAVPPYTEPESLFPADHSLSPECVHYLALTRCVFSSKMALESLSYLTHFVKAIPDAGAKWSPSSELSTALEGFGGDVVQAVQALKEARPTPTDELKKHLVELIVAFQQCRSYCDRGQVDYLFGRSERQTRDVYHFLYSDALPDSSPGADEKPQIVVKLPELPSTEKVVLGNNEIPRLLNGFWQLSSPAWGSGTAEKQEAALVHLVESGLVAADMADHYGDAELIYGDFRSKLADDVRSQVYAATKWCVFSPPNCPITHEWVLAAVKERSRRLGGRVELLQFHWHDYEAKEYLDILVELVNISKQHPDLVSSVGLCNFDSEHVSEACEHLLQKRGEVGLVSNQVQFSLFDSRPLQKMCETCSKYGLKLLTYGSFCGGFISQKWLGQTVPEVYSESLRLTPSQRKYLEIIRTWGSWEQFQALLEILSASAQKHGVSLTNVATRWVLQQESVGAVIVGTRLGVAEHASENLAVFSFTLSEYEMAGINKVALGENGERSQAMFAKLGDCGNEYRAMH